MRKEFRKWLAPPIFEGDEEKTWRAEILNTSIIITLLVIAFILVGSFLGGRIPKVTFIIEGMMFVSFLSLRSLLLRGNIAFVGRVFLSLGIIFLVGIVASLGTVRGPATVGFLLVIIISGLVFSKNGILLNTIATSLAVLGLIIAENIGILPTPDYVVNITQWVTYTTLFGLTGALTYFSHKTTRQALSRTFVEMSARKASEKALQESEEKFRSLVEQSQDGIALIAQSGIILEWNQGMVDITGFSRDSMLGTLLWESQYQLATDERKSPELAKRIEIGVRTLLENKELLLSRKMEERPIQRPDGRIRNMQSIIYPITIKNGFMMGMISRDITERKEAEAEIAKRTAQLDALSKIGIEITSQRDCQKILATIMKEMLRLVDGIGGGIYLYNKEKKILEWAIGVNAMIPKGDTLQRGEGMGGAVWESGKTISISDYSNWEKQSKGVCSTPSRSPMMGTPICWIENFLGVLIVRGKSGDTFTEGDTKLLETISAQTALAIRNARLFSTEYQARQEAQTLQAATQAISSSLALPDVLTTIISELQKVLPYDSCSVLKIDEDYIEIVAGAGFVNTEEIIGLRFSLGNEDDNPSSIVINTSQSFIVDDVSIYSSFHQEETIQNKITSWLGVPMFIEGEVVGIIAIDKKEKGFFNNHHKEIAEAFATQASLALKKAELFAESHKLAQAVNFSGSSVLITDLDGKIEFVNDAFSIMSGYSAKEIIGKGTSILKSGKTEIKIYEELWGKITQGNIWRGELLNRKKTGELYWDAMVISPIIDKDNKITHYVAMQDEITERKEKEKRLAHQVTHDILTNLPNRAFFNERIKHALALAKRNSWQVALLFIDLNDFKAINDTFGHNVGDDVLIEFGKRLQTSVRDSDTVVRLGGDEFTCLLENISSKDKLAFLAKKIIANIKMPFDVNEELRLELSASIGISVFPQDGKDAATLLKNADQAMYSVKKQKGTCEYKFYNASDTVPLRSKSN